jgi:hypothetical protein
MRRFGFILLVPAFVSAATLANAGQPDADKQPDKPAAAPAEITPPPSDASAPSDVPPASPPKGERGSKPNGRKVDASNETPQVAPAPANAFPKPATAVAAEHEPIIPRLLAPTFSEDRYPGDGRGSETEVVLVRPGKMPPLRFAMHGYFRAPMRFSRVKRDAGTMTPTEGNYNYRTPMLVDDDYYQSGFLYLPINERPWNETYLSVGNERMTATVGLMNSQFADSDVYKIENQFGVAQGWLTYRFKPVDNLSVRVKGGAFWDRFGYLPKYDTYIFGRTHQVGGQLRAEYQAGDFTFWALDGVGTHEGQFNAKQGMTMVHYAQAGASYDRTVEVSLYYLNASTKDKHPLQELTDASMTVLGADVRLKTLMGRGYLAFSSIDANQVLYLSPAIEVMHSYGRFIMDNYLGNEAKSNRGKGGLQNLGFQYDFSVADLYRGLNQTKASPLPWGGDITASVFGVRTKVASDQPTDWTDVASIRASRRDGVTKWKWGTEVGWRATEWAGVWLRYDHVVPDTDDSAASFRVISPRIALFTHLLSQEMIFLQFSRYWYKQAVQLRGGTEPWPDEKVIKLQAQISY